MLIPKIITEFNAVEKIATTKDVTGNYNETINPNGWGAPNIERAEIVSAIVEIYKSDGLNSPSLIQSLNVTNIVKASTNEEIILDLGDGYTFNYISEDGLYKIVYRINGQSYISKPNLVFVTNKIEEQISKHWAELSCIHDIYDKKKLETECIWLETHLSGIKAIQRRGWEAEFYNTLRFIEQRIEVNISNKLVKI